MEVIATSLRFVLLLQVIVISQRHLEEEALLRQTKKYSTLNLAYLIQGKIMFSLLSISFLILLFFDISIIYTPPTYSDHVAVSLYLSLSMNSLDLNEKDSDTKKTQPHKVQKSISDFFGQRKRSSCSANKSTAKLPKMMKR